MTQTLAEAIQEAYEKGWVNDPDDPWVDLDCFGREDPETNTKFTVRSVHSKPIAAKPTTRL